MALSKIRLGEYIELYKEKCNIPHLANEEVSGINRDKEFFEPSKQVAADTSNYKVVPPLYYACNLMHIGRDIVLPIAINRTNKSKYVSPAYTIFTLKDEKKILREYLFILLNSSEKDRYFWFHCDSSVRDGMEWSSFCDIELEVPSIEIQKKYVAIYEGLLANLHSYERGLDDLKLVCDGYIENLRKSTNNGRIGKYICQSRIINSEGKVDKLAGLIGGNIEEARKSSGQENFRKFQVLYPGTIVYPPPHFGEVGTIGYVKNKPVLMSPMYIAFKAIDSSLMNLEYALIWFRREEFKRFAFFMSCDSIRDTFDFDKLCEYKMPIPSIDIQNDIVSIFNEKLTREKILKSIKERIKFICPILIRGSIEESKEV